MRPVRKDLVLVPHHPQELDSVPQPNRVLCPAEVGAENIEKRRSPGGRLRRFAVSFQLLRSGGSRAHVKDSVFPGAGKPSVPTFCNLLSA